MRKIMWAYIVFFVLIGMILSPVWLVASSGDDQSSPEHAALTFEPRTSPGLPNRSPEGSVVWTDFFTAMTRLGTHFMPYFGDGDSMTEPVWLWSPKPDKHPYGSSGLVETWYIYKDPGPGRGPIWRLYSNQTHDHMDSPKSTSGATLGYVPEFNHGYASTVSLPGMSPMIRYLNSGIFDHSLGLHPTAPQGYHVDWVWDSGSYARFGYKRFGNYLDRFSVMQPQYETVLSTSRLVVRFNKIWGNAIRQINLRKPNGQWVQIVDDGDIGALVQATIFGPAGNDINPTEAGGVSNLHYGDTTLWSGSPIISERIYQGSPPWVETVLKPLNFQTAIFPGSDEYSPLVWHGDFTKKTWLGWSNSGNTWDDVLHIRFEAQLDWDIPSSAQGAANMNNTFWLRMGVFGDGNKKSGDQDFIMTLYHPLTGTSDVIDYPPSFESGNNYVWLQSSDSAVIIRKTREDFAIGIGRRGSYFQYKIMFHCAGVNPDPQDGSCPASGNHQDLVVDTFKGQYLKPGWSGTDDVFLVFGTYQEVKDRLFDIFDQ